MIHLIGYEEEEDGKTEEHKELHVIWRPLPYRHLVAAISWTADIHACAALKSEGETHCAPFIEGASAGIFSCALVSVFTQKKARGVPLNWHCHIAGKGGSEAQPALRARHIINDVRLILKNIVI